MLKGPSIKVETSVVLPVILFITAALIVPPVKFRCPLPVRVKVSCVIPAVFQVTVAPSSTLTLASPVPDTLVVIVLSAVKSIDKSPVFLTSALKSVSFAVTEPVLLNAVSLLALNVTFSSFKSPALLIAPFVSVKESKVASLTKT